MDSKKLLNLTLLALGLGGIFFLYFRFNPSEQAFFLPCPFHYLTGLHCPGCGSQRAIHFLLHGEIGSAFWTNPLMVLSIPLVIYAFAQRAWNYLKGSHYRVGIFYNKVFIYGYFSIAVLFWIVRNIPYHPFLMLSPESIP